jgi:hypothetical protein
MLPGKTSSVVLAHIEFFEDVELPGQIFGYINFGIGIAWPYARGNDLDMKLKIRDLFCIFRLIKVMRSLQRIDMSSIIIMSILGEMKSLILWKFQYL